MYQQFRPQLQLPPITKNLILINVIMLLATYVLRGRGIDLYHYLALYYPGADNFMPTQYITYMFMHATTGRHAITHILFNMFALYMFGRVLESVWGPKRFLIFYMVTGVGAALLHTLVSHLDIAPMAKAAVAFSNTPTAELFNSFINKYQGDLKSLGFNLTAIMDYAIDWMDDPDSMNYQNEAINLVNTVVRTKMSIPTVGASGAVFGILLGFGMLFPNTQLMLLFPPIPIKAKYMVIGYGALELVLGLSMPGSNIAHFAHLGGMLFGFILIKYWNKSSDRFY